MSDELGSATDETKFIRFTEGHFVISFTSYIIASVLCMCVFICLPREHEMELRRERAQMVEVELGVSELLRRAYDWY